MQLGQLALQLALLLLQLAEARLAELVGDGDVAALLLCESCCLKGPHPVTIWCWGSLTGDEVDVVQLKRNCRTTNRVTAGCGYQVVEQRLQDNTCGELWVGWRRAAQRQLQDNTQGYSRLWVQSD
jgi:hypothetical protein